MSDRLGRTAVRFAFRYLRQRYRREIRIGIALSLGAIAVAIYLANRNPPEG